MAVIRDYRDGYARTSPVGSFRPNRFGLYDLGGNAWEWCFDWYRKEANDPTVLKAFPVLAADGGGGTYRVYRGGGWNDANGSVLLSANRMGDGFAESSKRYDNTGFRVVLGDLTEPANDSKLLPGVAPSETAVSSESSTTHPATSTKPQANAAATADWKRGLVLYFNFDEPPKGRVVRDESGLGNDGHVVGATWTARGRRGGAFAFHRTTNYIRVPNTASLNPPSLTAAAWIKTSYTDKTWRRIFDKDKRSSFALTILGDLDNFHPASRYRGHLGMVWASGFALSDNSAADGQWHHVATVADSSHIWTFVDGQMQHRVANSKGEVGKNDSPLYIGGFVNPNPKYSDIGQSFDGLIDEVMIFNRALSMEEVRQLYESP
jgi:hypothetical protein